MPLKQLDLQKVQSDGTKHKCHVAAAAQLSVLRVVYPEPLKGEGKSQSPTLRSWVAESANYSIQQGFRPLGLYALRGGSPFAVVLFLWNRVPEKICSTLKETLSTLTIISGGLNTTVRSTTNRLTKTGAWSKIHQQQANTICLPFARCNVEGLFTSHIVQACELWAGWWKSRFLRIATLL